ncbi:spondin-1 isoform X3 [Rhodnius prolixus]|uniref:spondin-1 isoform X3 n=1 Tax=Rhodnius prolixus TaxID=13249 RepID=UPI003D18C482
MLCALASGALKLLLILACWAGRNDAVPKCDKVPEGITAAKSRADNRFTLEILGKPETYSPGEMYTVSLKGGPRGSTIMARFIGFSLTVDTTSRTGAAAGNLHLFGDSLTKYSDDCPNTITHTSLVMKTEVQAMWSAPPPGTGCVIFSATVIERKDLWYQGDKPLSIILCEDLQQTIDEQPEINQQCCACDEAKYEVTFEGLWSRHTHPKDFPDNWMTRFSDVIGASHSTDYRFWDYGGIASEGLEEVAELGSTRQLESELKSQSQNIRTIIKARGISYPNVTGKTFAVFRVDSKHHLISLVSMIDPSPDWIVGVSALELCLSNCSWLENKMLNLYPWDVGTDSGITYTSPDMPTEPKDHIRRITSSFPADPGSPFYDPSGQEMKPLARLHLIRQRLYEKSCSDVTMEDNSEACEVGEWSDWSPCSVSCGSGKRSRQRFYKNENLASLKNCNRELTTRSYCYSGIPCRDGTVGVTSQEKEPEPDETCAVTSWSQWSGCSVSCGKGVKHRFRRLENRRNWKKCMFTQNPLVLKEDDVCIGEEGEECQVMAAALSTKCEVGPWSEWSTCSVTCGQGSRIRKREILSPKKSNSPTADDPCSGIKTMETISCSDLPNCQLTPDQAREVCQLPKVVGPCRGHFEKWFFDAVTHTCRKFAFSGCRGNRNQFSTQEECETICKELKGEGTTLEQFSGFAPASLVAGPYGPVVDCKVSHWSDWSPCSVSCGRGLKQKNRRIIVNSRNGGKPCPKKIIRRKKCNKGPCTTGFVSDEMHFSTSDYKDSTQEDDCVYSDWTPWSLCSATCGLNSVQQRTRSIDYIKTRDPANCLERLETRVCNVSACRRNN